MNLVKKENHMSEKEYRSIKTALSYSSLKLFNTNRQQFFKEFILGEKKTEKQSDALVLGSLVHTLLAEIDFESKFHIAVNSAPVGQMGLLVDELYNRSVKTIDENGVQQDNFSVIFGDAFLKVKYAYDGEEIAFKKKDVDKVLQMFQETGELYYKERLEAIGKTVVSMSQIEQAERLVQKIKEHPYTYNIANAKTGDGIEVYNEFPILFDIEGVECKAMPDKLVVDHINKIIKTYDFKTSWDVFDANYMYLKHHYYIQLAIYYSAVLHYKQVNQLTGYTIEPLTFIFIDTTNFLDPILLQPSLDDVERAIRGFSYRGIKYEGVKDIMDEIAYCISTGCWTTTKELKENKGVQKLKIAYGTR